MIQSLDNQLRKDLLIIKDLLDSIVPGVDEYVPDDEYWAAHTAMQRALENLGIADL